jgi:alpha-galactosidase
MRKHISQACGGAAVRRRHFLAGLAGAAGLLPRHPAGAQPVRRWRLGESGEYAVTHAGTALTVDCPAADAPPPGAEAALLRVGPKHRPVTWQVATAHQADARSLRIVLAAEDVPLHAELAFTVDAASGMLVRRTALHHTGIGAPVDVTGSLSFHARVHEPLDRLLHLAGAWAHETQVRHGQPDAPLHMESRAGKTGFDFQPYVALLTGTSAYVCELLWSGNWQMQVTPQPDGATLSAGLNDWRFRHRLGPVNPLTLPAVLFGRFPGGLNAATQRLHDYRRAHRPDPDRPIAVQFNSWYPYFGDPTADAMLPLVPVAARLGCEAFVVDAGWYRTDDGDSDADWAARTGDWRTSRTRFPGGLRAIGAACHEHGMQFGLWFEPEVIGPLAALRREHPDWLHQPDGRPPPDDQRAVLNLGVPAARQHVFERMTRIVSAAGVDWVKWDFNADMDSGGWAPGLPAALTAQDPLVAHYEGLYRLQDAIRRWFPALTLEMCASGGGRMDGAILSHAHVNWISDQPGAVRKLAIHLGTQLAHPAVVCNDWLVEWPPGSIAGYDEEDAAGLDERGDLPFRLRVAMLGSFGISARADRWPAADFATVAAHVAVYRERVRQIVQLGDQYLLTRAPPADGTGDWAAVWYVAKDGGRGVLFAFRLAGGTETQAFPLPGLRPEQAYTLEVFGSGTTQRTGSALMAGCTVTVPQPFGSALCLIDAA